MNLLGLSTQVHGSYLYLSDGPNKCYEVAGATLEFKKTALKDIGFKHRESTLLVQALKALGKAHITPTLIEALRAQVPPKNYSKILRDTRSTTGWIYETLKEICRSDDE